MGKFTYSDGLQVVEIIKKDYNGEITIRELGALLRKHTGTMQSWWIKQYAQDMVLADLLESDGKVFRIKK